jgi:hypothetical protein
MTAAKPPPITRDDIESKFRELQTEVDLVEDDARSYVGVAVIGTVVVLVALAFLLGRRRGKRRGTIVEIRRV